MEFPKDHLESLWAPWRVEYFETEHGGGGEFLLEAARATDDAAHLVVARGRQAFLIMNKYPYTAGHLMAVPYRRVADIGELTAEEMLDLWGLVTRAQAALRHVVKAQGFNVGCNIGRAGGAGVEEHLHIHIVPRWAGDSNFMPVLGGARIIPEALQPLYEKLRATLADYP